MHKNAKATTSSLVILLVISAIFSALTVAQFVAVASAAGYTEYTGTIGGVNYVVRFPDHWNGMLVVITQAGGSSPVLDARTSSYNSTAAPFLDNGYAVAASNYGGATGYCHTKAVNSTYAITKYIIDTYHITGKVFLYGNSMGGSFAFFVGQQHPELYAGVLDQGGGKNATAHYMYYDTIANLTIQGIRNYLNAPSSISDATLQSLKTACVSFLTYYQNETGGTPQQVPQEYAARSAINYPNMSIPMITIHASDDILVPVSQTINYQSAVAAAGRSTLYRVYISTVADIASQVPIRFNELVSWASAASGWAVTVDSRSLKAYPNLKENIWQKNATMAPNGLYDKIGLHRLTNSAMAVKGAIFIDPGSSNGTKIVSNPANDSWTKTESNSQAVYWATRGFDVYSIDQRWSFVPTTLSFNQTSFMANWGVDVLMSDYKECVEAAKQFSNVNKVFLVSAGGSAGTSSLAYAALYWKQDLAGIILLDSVITARGGPVVLARTPTNTFNLTKALIDMNSSGSWTTDLMSTAGLWQYALQNPSGPAAFPNGTAFSPPVNPLTNKTWANATEWANYIVSSTYNAYSNVNGGYGNATMFLWNWATYGRYSPYRITLDFNASGDWVSCPYLNYDWDDHWKEIGVPMLAFASDLYTNYTGSFRFVNGIASTDFTGVFLKNYGHYDVQYGVYAPRDVSEPTYQWMLSHLSTLDVTARSNATVWPGWTWWFYVQNLGGNSPYTYQWYEGLNPIQGQTQMVLPVTKSTTGVYSFYCRVTDKDGTTTTSNYVTLTVMG